MKIISYNVNGIRAASKKGLIDWLAIENADIVCLQETKAHETDIDHARFQEMGYTGYWASAEKKGYSGTAIFTKGAPALVTVGCNDEQSDKEGRVVSLFISDIMIVNAYFPSGTSGDARQQYKYEWLAMFNTYLENLWKTYPNIVLCGDYNIAHKPIDIHDPKGNKNSSGFLPEEREWMDKFLANGWTDTFRHFYPDQTGAYTWWSQRFPSVREQNKGWRIDYICTYGPIIEDLRSATICPMAKHSDHCPIILEIGDRS